jgi:hypothetical protein
MVVAVAGGAVVYTVEEGAGVATTVEATGAGCWTVLSSFTLQALRATRQAMAATGKNFMAYAPFCTANATTTVTVARASVATRGSVRRTTL